MKTLIVEDSFSNRHILQAILSPFGEAHVATTGKEAVEAFQAAWAEQQPYHLICLDIMIPEMNGQEVLKTIRKYEHDYEIFGSRSVKIIMITALADFENIKSAFKEQCESYLIKPVNKAVLLETVAKLGLIDNP